MADAHPTVIDVPEQSGVQLNEPAIGDESVRFSWRFRLRLNLPLLFGAAIVLLSIGLTLYRALADRRTIPLRSPMHRSRRRPLNICWARISSAVTS